MRKSMRIIFLLAVLSMLGWVQHAKPELLSLAHWQTEKLDPEKVAMVAQAKVSRAFLLTPQWLHFPLEGQASELRLISTANVADIALARRQHLANPSHRWHYALEVELLDAQGKVVQNQRYQQHANLFETQRADGKLSSAAFYLQENLSPLSSEVATLRAGQSAATSMRVRLLPAPHSAIKDVVLRVYQTRATSPTEASHRWQRLSKQQQEDLARATVHDAALLQEHEKQNLLRNTRQALGPSGQEGRDYQVRDLYLLHENQGTLQSTPIAPYGVQFDSQVYASIALPEQGGLLRLEISANPATLKNQQHGAIQLRWFGVGLFQKSSSELAWQGVPLQHRMQVKGGLLELQGPSDLVVRAFLSHAGKEQEGEQEITPVAQYERVFSTNASQPLIFALSNSQQLSGLRLSLRSFGKLPLAKQLAYYEAFNAQCQSLGRGEIAVAAEPAHYERLVGDFSKQEAALLATEQQQLSELSQGFFVLPANTAQLKVWAAQTLLVAAHTRPYSLARELRLPDDHYSYDALGKRIPAWFSLAPQNEEELISQMRSRVLLVQNRPLPETAEQAKIMQGAFQWQDYRPRGNWLARPIFTPRDVDVPFRAEALPSTYTPLALNVQQSLDFPNYHGTEVITPSLIWLGAAQAASLTLELDGKPFSTLTVHGPYGEYPLPALAAGRHQLRVRSSSKGQVYINHVTANAHSLVRRIGQRFTQELVFDYERQHASAETLSARLYQIGGKLDAHSRIKLKIEGPAPSLLKPLSAWLFAERVASVRRAPEQGKVFDTAGQISDAGSPIYLPFPADAPLGRYKISIQLEGGASQAQQHYLSLSRLSSRLEPKLYLHQQAELRPTHNTERSHVTIIE